MPEDNDIREVPTRGGMTGRNSFDELAKGLASGTITRVQALKLVGAAILSSMLVPVYPGRAFAQSEDDPCGPTEEDCGGYCCGATEECCGGICCGATEECCAGTCCEIGKVCVGGWCVCAPGSIPCGSDCCNPPLETCVAGQCRNLFCESCAANGYADCCQVVDNGVVTHQLCCSAGESVCSRAGLGCLCCPGGTRCPRPGEAFVCIAG